MESPSSRFARIALSFVLAGGLLAGGLLAGAATVASARDQAANPYRALLPFARTLDTIEQHYVDPIPTTTLIHGALRGMTEELDRHSFYLDPEVSRDFEEGANPGLASLGAELKKTSDGFAVGHLVEQGPAALAGIQTGDVVVAVDGAATAGWSNEDLRAHLRGARGQTVHLDVERNGTRLSLDVARDQVLAPVVHGELVSPGRAYVRIDEFRALSSDEFDRTLATLARENGAPLTAIILDLRANPGGLIDEAAAVVDRFLADGPIVEARGRGGKLDVSYTASAADDDLDARLVVLVDHLTASAAEIVAGALQARGRARLVGERTYGKVAVQRIFRYEDGSALKLTVGRHVLAGKATLEDGEGLTPDVVVNEPGLAQSKAQRALDAVAALDLYPDDRARIERNLHVAIERAGELPPSEFPRDGTVAERAPKDPQLMAALQALDTAN